MKEGVGEGCLKGLLIHKTYFSMYYLLLNCLGYKLCEFSILLTNIFWDRLTILATATIFTRFSIDICKQQALNTG